MATLVNTDAGTWKALVRKTGWPTKKPTTQRAEATKAQLLISHLGKYSMAALSAEIIAS
ncbi:hypothetical protein D3C87_2051190 [compost metagenome]